MEKRKYNNVILLVVFALYIVCYRLFIATSEAGYNDFINAALVSLIAFASTYLLGFRKDRLTNLKKNVLGMTITEIILFFVISYGLGTVTGFVKNTYPLDAMSILSNVLAPIVYVVAIEIFRYAVVNANQDKKWVIYTATFFIIVLELMMGLNGVLMYDFETTFRVVSSIILPIIIKNSTLTYLSYAGGLKSTVIYRLVMDTYMFVLPMIPELGDYISSVIGILLPTFVYMYASRMVEEHENSKEEQYTKKSIKLSDIPMTIFIIVLVGLISGNFKYAIIGVGSESMQPWVNKGDAVVYEQVKKPEDIKVDDVIVFKSGSKVIIHRLVDIKESKGETYYITRGDANNGNDSLHLTIDNIKGKVIFKVKYLAVPNLLLQDLLDNK